MKIIILTVLTLYFLCPLIKAQCADPKYFYYGYWGADLTQTSTPNMIWDTEDVNQLTYARDHGVRVLFYLQKLLFKYGIGPQGFSLKSNWSAIFDEAYGNETYSKNPYGIANLYGFSPNGFFLGSELMYDSTTINATTLNPVIAYIHSKFPSSLIALDENWQLFYGENKNKVPINIDLQDPLDLISVSHFWADCCIHGDPPVGTLSPTGISGFYRHKILPHLNGNIRMVWTIGLYETSLAYEATSCGPPPGEHCEYVQINRTVETFDHMCRDRKNCGETDEYYDPHSDKVKGIWGWHWDYRPAAIGYETGLSGMPNLLDFEQYFGTLACELSPASYLTISIFNIIIFTLITLI